MQIEGYDGEVSAYISNDYLGMSQRPETKEAGINAVLKYGTGASAAQAIGGYLDIHQQLEQGIAKFVGQEDASSILIRFWCQRRSASCYIGKKMT